MNRKQKMIQLLASSIVLVLLIYSLFYMFKLFLILFAIVAVVAWAPNGHEEKEQLVSNEEIEKELEKEIEKDQK